MSFMKIITSASFILISIQVCTPSTENRTSDKKEPFVINAKVLYISPEGTYHIPLKEDVQKAKQICSDIKLVTREVASSIIEDVTLFRKSRLCLTVPVNLNSVDSNTKIDFTDSYAEKIKTHSLHLQNMVSQIVSNFFPKMHKEEDAQNPILKSSYITLCQEFLPAEKLSVDLDNAEEVDDFLKEFKTPSAFYLPPTLSEKNFVTFFKDISYLETILEGIIIFFEKFDQKGLKLHSHADAETSFFTFMDEKEFEAKSTPEQEKFDCILKSKNNSKSNEFAFKTEFVKLYKNRQEFLYQLNMIYGHIRPREENGKITITFSTVFRDDPLMNTVMDAIIHNKTDFFNSENNDVYEMARILTDINSWGHFYHSLSEILSFLNAHFLTLSWNNHLGEFTQNVTERVKPVIALPIKQDPKKTQEEMEQKLRELGLMDDLKTKSKKPSSKKTQSNQKPSQKKQEVIPPSDNNESESKKINSSGGKKISKKKKKKESRTLHENSTPEEIIAQEEEFSTPRNDSDNDDVTDEIQKEDTVSTSTGTSQTTAANTDSFQSSDGGQTPRSKPTAPMSIDQDDAITETIKDSYLTPIRSYRHNPYQAMDTLDIITHCLLSDLTGPEKSNRLYPLYIYLQKQLIDLENHPLPFLEIISQNKIMIDLIRLNLKNDMLQ